jgi:hypothetical protein
MPRTLIIALLALALAPLSSAQMRGGVHVGAAGTGFRHVRSGGFAYPFFYSDYGPESEPPPPAPPLVIEKKVMQSDRPTEPLLIEWQGDHFVRYGGAAASASPDYVEVASISPPAKAAALSEARHELPPAILVYRDGHREEVSDYVITRGVLYARGDGYSQASRNIQLSALDLRTTFRANQDQGVKFVLPERSNDVVTRP